jgi:hypothetical protein
VRQLPCFDQRATTALWRSQRVMRALRSTSSSRGPL